MVNQRNLAATLILATVLIVASQTGFLGTLSVTSGVSQVPDAWSASTDTDSVVKGETITVTIQNNAGANGFEVENSRGSTIYFEPDNAFIQQDPWNMPETYTFELPTEGLSGGSQTVYIKDVFCTYNFDVNRYQCNNQELYDTVSFTVNVDSDGDGVLDRNDECPVTGDQGRGVDSSGCPFEDGDGDGVLDRNDECSETFGSKNSGCPTLVEGFLHWIDGLLGTDYVERGLF